MFKPALAVVILFIVDSGLIYAQEKPEVVGVDGHGANVQYIRQDIPAFDIPAYAGDRYRELIPDTLDLGERARLAINCLTRSTGADNDYDIYFWLWIFTGNTVGSPFRNPPVMMRDISSWCHMKFCESLPLMRTIAGDIDNHHVDEHWMKSILKCIGPDGLYYWPLEGRPWYRQQTWMGTGIFDAQMNPRAMSDPEVTQFAFPLSGRYMSAMSIYYLRDKNPMWIEIMKKMTDRWAELAIDKGDYCYFPSAGYLPHAKIPQDLPEPKSVTGHECNNRLTQGLIHFYRISGYEPARELARKQIQYMIKRIGLFDDQGRYIDGKEGVFEVSIFHCYSFVLHTIVDYILATGDKELLGFVQKAFRYGLEQQVIPTSTLTGWFPENLRPNYPSSELCAIADMLAVAVKLSDMQVTDYWDEVDRWTRNAFVEGQLTRSDWVYRFAAKEPPTPVEDNETAVQAVERNIGGFSGWASGNEWAIRHGIMHCCTGNATRTIYQVWKRILEYKDGTLTVNLLLNRASKWADIQSHIPYQGQVDIKIKEDCRHLRIRVPQWIRTGSDELICSVNGTTREPTWEGRYVNLGPMHIGQTATLTFPIQERTVVESIGGVEYHLVIKGNTVVLIDPPGRYNPLYQRDHYRENNTRWVKADRFASESEFDW